jgi:hypothetical protein
MRPQMPLSSARHFSQHEARPRLLPSVPVPRWFVILALAAALALLGFHALVLHSQRSGIAKDISRLRSDLLTIEQRIGLLEINIETASDPTSIHTKAVNVLGMSQPTDDQIITITLPPSP